MRSIRVRHERRDEHGPRRGQALVEYALVLPIVLVLVASVADLGLIFGRISSLGYASREGARAGSALARGGVSDCSDPTVVDPPVDAVVVAAVQRILTSPDSGIDMDRIRQIRIFKATALGAETPGVVNVWKWRDAEVGPDIDPDPLVEERLEFTRLGPEGWPACGRRDTGVPPNSIGVTVSYTYDFVTPLPALINALAGGSLSLTLNETTVMALNPTF